MQKNTHKKYDFLVFPADPKNHISKIAQTLEISTVLRDAKLAGS